MRFQYLCAIVAVACTLLVAGCGRDSSGFVYAPRPASSRVAVRLAASEGVPPVIAKTFAIREEINYPQERVTLFSMTAVPTVRQHVALEYAVTQHISTGWIVTQLWQADSLIPPFRSPWHSIEIGLYDMSTNGSYVYSYALGRALMQRVASVVVVFGKNRFSTYHLTNGVFYGRFYTKMFCGIRVLDSSGVALEQFNLVGHPVSVKTISCPPNGTGVLPHLVRGAH